MKKVIKANRRHREEVEKKLRIHYQRMVDNVNKEKPQRITIDKDSYTYL